MNSIPERCAGIDRGRLSVCLIASKPVIFKGRVIPKATGAGGGDIENLSGRAEDDLSFFDLVGVWEFLLAILRVELGPGPA